MNPPRDPYQIAREIMAKRREHEAEDARLLQERSNSKISVEFGDATVTFRDGLGRIIRRIGLSGPAGGGYRWTEALGQAMAERGCTEFGCRISEQAAFSARQAMKEAQAIREVRGAGPAMELVQTSPEY